MPLDILLTVIATTIIQSIFGVGILLFGTPLLLLLGYQFINALEILLPISISINMLQLLKHHSFIDIDFVKNVLKFSIPFVVVFLFIVTSVRINIGVFIGFFLIFVALKDVVGAINKIIAKLVSYERSYLVSMGIIHGLTNLGGSLLTAMVHSKQYEKDQTRATVAVCYGMFAVFQILTMFFIDHSYLISYSDNVSLLQIAVIVFLLTEEMLYKNIDNDKYAKFFAAFLGVSGAVLIWKSL